MNQQKQFEFLLRPVLSTEVQNLKTGLNKKAFTLVELIVVVTILAILSTIGFVSYSSYLIWVRDTNRVSNMKAISDWLELYRTKFTLPLPEDSVDIKANGSVISYQWYAWANVLESIEFSNGWKDPKDDIYYSYYLTRDKKYFQLMWFLEDEENLEASSESSLIVTSSQEWIIDYSSRFPKVYWSKLWILTDNSNIPVQEITSIALAKKIELDTTNSWTTYNLHINDGRTYSFTWYILNHKLYTLSKSWIYGPPKDCPDWFIAAWWDSTFNQVGFCVAQYEMTYMEKDSPWIPNSVWSGDPWNTYNFDEDFDGILEVWETGYWKKIISRAWDYPITDLSQSLAIDACKSMWKWYHLIMNSEWMSLTRQIELEKDNRSGWEVGNWFISNWISGDVTLWCADVKWWDTETYWNYGGKTWPLNNSCDEKRKHKLFNYQEIWDLSWNVVEWVNKANTLDWSWYATIPEAHTSLWIGWDSVRNEWIDVNFTSTFNYGPIIGKNYTNWVGGLYDLDWEDDNVFIRGGAAWNSYPGIFGLDLSWNTSSEENSAGFRCAYIKQ